MITFTCPYKKDKYADVRGRDRLYRVRMIRRLLCAVMLVAALTPATGTQSLRGALAAAIEAELLRLPARTGLYLKHLKTGEEVALRADESFNSQSVIKIPTRVGGADVLNRWLEQAGYKMRMINRGWEYRRKLLARLDPRFASITAEDVTGLQYAMSDNPLFDHYRSLFTGPRAAWLDVVRNPENRRIHNANTRRLMVEDRDIWLGDMTAREIGRMLEAIERETIASAASAATMRTFMRRQLAGSRRLPHFVDVPVAHKTGDSGNIANDVGIIYSRSGPIVIAVMVNGITGNYGEAEDRIGRIATLVVDHFDSAVRTK
jgi:hypothetical protein